MGFIRNVLIVILWKVNSLKFKTKIDHENNICKFKEEKQGNFGQKQQSFEF